MAMESAARLNKYLQLQELLAVNRSMDVCVCVSLYKLAAYKFSGNNKGVN